MAPVHVVTVTNVRKLDVPGRWVGSGNWRDSFQRSAAKTATAQTDAGVNNSGSVINLSNALHANNPDILTLLRRI